MKKDAVYLDETFKVDAVRKMERPKMTIAYIAPATDTERRVADIFEGFFGIADIGVEDNFYELGGDSLKGMMLLKRVKKEFSVHLPLKEFLSNITIRAVAARIDELSWLKAGADMENEVVI
jgi:acyl carrier protein